MEITNFEKDYMIFKIGYFEFLNSDTIAYHKFNLVKIEEKHYKVLFLDNVIFKGILKDCLEFMEDNYYELYPETIPIQPKDIDVNILLESYKEFIIKRFTNIN